MILSSFTHLWNPIGFPAIWAVEGQYIQRAIPVLEGFDLHESKDINPHLYDYHPFFGQSFLAGVFAMKGYHDLFSILLYFCLDVLVLFSHISKEIICLTMDSSISNISLCYRFCLVFYLILLSPAICISAARLIVDLPNKVKKIRFQQILPFAIISIIGFFGLGSITILITLMCMYLLYNT